MIAPVYDRLGVQLYEGDCRDVLPQIPTGSVSAIVTDPPYELGFMGRGWDASGIAYDVDMWRECLRVLAPGGHLVSFGGTRTYHRMAVAVEDAEFEIRDGLMWLYGQGFPKSLDIGKALDKAAGAVRPDRVVSGPAGNTVFQPTQRVVDAGTPVTEDAKRWNGWGTALKPGFEPIVLARKPFVGTTSANVVRHGTGALNVAATQVGGGEERRFGVNVGMRGGKYGASAPTSSAGMMRVGTEGRFPSNVLLSHLPECGPTEAPEPCTRGCPVLDLEGQAAGASAFFPTFRYQAKAGADGRPLVDGVGHSTVKPLQLMYWLTTLITPPGGIVLDPFAGSGATLRAAVDAGFPTIGIELTPAHIPMITKRLQSRRRLARPVEPAVREVDGQGSVFDMLADDLDPLGTFAEEETE